MEKTILITGATDGIGKQIAYDLAKKGHSIILHGRKENKLISTIDALKSKFPDVEVGSVLADFSSLDQVKQMAEDISTRYDHLDVLINNAGIYQTQFKKSADGFEMNLAVNYLAVYVLTKNLLKLIVKSSPSRIINVSSITHKRGRIDLEKLQEQNGQFFDSYKAYADSKLMLIYFTYCLSDELIGSGVTVNALHPGVITTKMLTQGFNMTGEDVKKGAETPVYLALSPEVQNISGKYFDKKLSVPSSRLSYELHIREAVMEWTRSVVNSGGWVA